MVETESAEKTTIETLKKPLIMSGFLGVFWNICTGAKLPVKAPAEEKVPPEAKKEHFCDRNTYTPAAAPEAEKKVLIENFEHFVVEGSRGASRKIHYGPEDHLGSTRMVLKAQNDGSSTVEQALMYQPYGTVSPVEGIGVTPTDPLRQKFTTKEFDEDGQLDLGLIEFNIALDFALTHTDPTKPNRVAVYYIDAPSKPDIINITIDPATDKGKLNTVLKNATARTIASIQFKLNDDAVTCNVENIAEITIPGAKLIIEKIFSNVSEFTPTVPKTFLNYSNESFYMAGIGSYHFGFRVYDPETGIWMSTDPKDQDFNVYGYCNNNPIMLVDPNGANWVGALIGAVVMGYTQGAISSGSFNPAKWESQDWFAAGMGAVSGAMAGSGIENSIAAARFNKSLTYPKSAYRARSVINGNGGRLAIKQRYLEHYGRYVDRATDWNASYTDMWLEGPSGAEPTGHMSFSVGDPNGSYKSYSFGVNGEYNRVNWMEGEIYSDATPGGQIIGGSYIKTSAAQDRAMQAAMDAKLGTKAPYLPNSTCRSWSRTFWNTANSMYGPAGEVPFQQLVPAGLLKVPFPFSSTVR